METRHKILDFKDFYEIYGTVFTDKEELNIKMGDLRGLAWIAATTLRREYEFDDVDLISATLFIEDNRPTGLLLNGVIWRSKWERGV